MAEYNAFYRRSVYYDIVFGRDVSAEVDFIETLYRAFHGHAPGSLLDLACGPGYHARSFAGRGKRAVGLDLNAEMIDFAQTQPHADRVEWVVGDMRYPQLETPVDLAINVFDGIDCLTRNDDLIAHLHAIAASLTPGGLYLIDVTHPRYTTFSHYEPFRYAGQRDNITVEIQWATNNPHVDPLTNIAHTQMRMTVCDDGEKIVIEDEADERILCAQEIILLASTALQPVAWYGDYDLDLPFDRNTERMIAVLQKPG